MRQMFLKPCQQGKAKAHQLASCASPWRIGLKTTIDDSVLSFERDREAPSLTFTGVLSDGTSLAIGFGEFVIPNFERRSSMNARLADRAGKIKYGLLGWLIGLPLPIVIILLFWGGCDF
jgi:hypothetical protein